MKLGSKEWLREAVVRLSRVAAESPHQVFAIDSRYDRVALVVVVVAGWCQKGREVSKSE